MGDEGEGIEKPTLSFVVKVFLGSQRDQPNSDKSAVDSDKSGCNIEQGFFVIYSERAKAVVEING